MAEGLMIKGGGGSGGSSSSSAVGGGNNTYSNINNTDFIATANVGTKTITVTGCAFTIDAKNVVSGSIKKVESSGANEALILTNVSVAGNVITLSNISDFASGDEVIVQVQGPDKRADVLLNANLNITQNPEYDHYTAANRIIDELNKSSAIPVRVVVQSDSYKNHVIQLACSGGVTMKLYATLDPSATTASLTYWEDISTTVMGAASLVDSTGLYFIDTAMMPVRFMVEYTLTDTSNAIDALWRKC